MEEIKTNYQLAKSELKEISVEAKKNFPTDKPMVRQIINDSINYIASDNNLSETQRDLLCNYACKLHP